MASSGFNQLHNVRADARTIQPAKLSAISRSPWSILTTTTLDREHRILFALLGVWIFSAFDLAFTISESRATHFIELNPIAATLLENPPHVIGAYKFGLLSAGTLILCKLRRYGVTELGAWFLFAACMYVMIRWHVYFASLVFDPVYAYADMPELDL